MAVMLQLAGPMVGVLLAIGLLLFASEKVNDSWGLSGSAATAVHLGTAIGLVTLRAVLKILERRWD